MLDPASTPQGEDSSEESTGQPAVEVTPGYLDYLEFISYRPYTYPGQQEMTTRLLYRHQGSPLD